MPERIETAQIREVDTDDLEIDDRFPGTFGFHVLLTRDPGPEWGVELDAIYEGERYSGKPPLIFNGDRLTIYYLPRYASDLPHYFAFLNGVVNETNRAVDLRNSVLPDEERERQEFRARLRDAAANLKAGDVRALPPPTTGRR